MSDLGAKYTDDQIIQMEKQLKSVYNQAYKDILQKQKDFNKKYEEKEAKYKEKVAKGQISQEEFDAWKKGQVFQGEQWQNKKKDILNTIYNSNKIATDIVNGKTQNVFTFNANYMSYELEHGAGVNFGFSLYDSATVVNLIKNDPQLLPKWKIDQPKDYTWNQKKLNRQISLGIIEGESLDKIATRFSDSLATQNFNKMRTFARTAMTGAQNSGRQTTLENAKGLGIKLKKEWMATLDNHTRINHILLDGQKVDTDDDFEVDGLKIRYPGDPQAVPAMTYNCRCTMVGDIEDYPATYDRYDNIDGKPIKNMTYTEWEAAKSKGEDISPVPLTYTEWEAAKKEGKPSANTIINGKDISATWKRRPDQFDFEIEDVINAQGFDGKPRVVSAEEFDKAVKVANNGNGFIAQRTYSAPDQETLDAYRDQLYNGKWYVDCSTGGAQYGQGMYCAADYTGTLSDGIKSEMKHYQELGEQRNYGSGIDNLSLDSFNTQSGWTLSNEEYLAHKRAYDSGWKTLSDDDKRLIRESGHSILEFDDAVSSVEIPRAVFYTETLTLDPSAKIITYSDLDGMRTYGNIETQIVNSMELSSEDRSILRQWIDDEDDVSNLPSNLLEIGQQIEKKADEYMDMDYGSLATMLGYDAINAEGHGQSGSYTVILNRTKVIIKGE